MKVNSSKQLGFGSVRRALDKIRGLFSIVAVVVGRNFLLIQILGRLNVLCTASAGILE